MKNTNCNFFVTNNSVVRNIWGKADTILFIFAGASAEFALNQSVDWLYFTGKLPADPLGRLFSTVGYARKIIFSETAVALQYIDQITAIHKSVEVARNANIPASAYLEVLYLLIDYSIRAFQLLERKLENHEKREVFDVFYRVGKRMALTGLPANYEEYQQLRAKQLAENLYPGHYTADLYKQYKKHLGLIRFVVLKQAQVLVVPAEVNQALSLGKRKWLFPVLYVYKFFRLLRLQNLLKYAILPANYTKQVMALDHTSH
jgi:hypothetical protein